jgi:hypothetical protein
MMEDIDFDGVIATKDDDSFQNCLLTSFFTLFPLGTISQGATDQ